MFGSGRNGARVALEADYEAAYDRFTEAGCLDDVLDMGWPLGHVWLLSGKPDAGIFTGPTLLSSGARPPSGPKPPLATRV